MIQKREFSNIHKQIVLSNQKHKCKSCKQHNVKSKSFMSRVHRKRKEDMNYICPKCKFQWHGDMDSFGKVLIHEKTHKKKGMN
jgi:transposase-like protein